VRFRSCQEILSYVFMSLLNWRREKDLTKAYDPGHGCCDLACCQYLLFIFLLLD
jgi:hypothetical protein